MMDLTAKKDNTKSLSFLERPGITAEQFQERAQQLLMEDPFLVYEILRILGKRRQLSDTDSGRRVMRRLHSVRGALTDNLDPGQRIKLIRQAFAPCLRPRY